MQVLLGDVSDLGSNPRSCIFPYYFAIIIPMQFQCYGSPYATIIQTSTCPLKIKPMAWIWRTRTLQSTHHMLAQKSMDFMLNWARFAKSTPPCWDRKPPWFASLYIFFILFFNLLFYFCFIVLIKLINFLFLQKYKNIIKTRKRTKI